MNEYTITSIIPEQGGTEFSVEVLNEKGEKETQAERLVLIP
jgi:hypothetical protein